jgi:D-xylose 1-dehydrogenase
MDWCRCQALKDRIHPEHVARLALSLAADDSNRCTGQQFVIDAG